MKNEDSSGCGLLIVGPVLLMAMVCAEAFVLSKLWLWHAVPLGAPAVRWTAFAAAALAWPVVRNRARPGVVDHDDKGTQAVKLLLFFAWPWVCLAMGWWLR